MPTSDRFIREAECREITGLSRTTRWRLEKTSAFPARKQISPNTVGWLLSEVLGWLQRRAGAGAVLPQPDALKEAQQKRAAKTATAA